MSWARRPVPVPGTASASRAWRSGSGFSTDASRSTPPAQPERGSSCGCPPMASARPIRVMLVDDHPLVAAGFKALLEPEFTVVAIVHDPADVPDVYRELRPDIVALDIALPGKSGLKVASELLADWPA